MAALFRFPLLVALCSQVVAFLLVWLTALAVAWLSGWGLGLALAACAQGVLAALIGQRLGLPRWWLPINLCFVPGLLVLQGHSLPSWLLLAIFVALLLLNVNALFERVPLYLTGPQAERILIERLSKLPKGFRFIDLGCGLGGTLQRLARACPHGEFFGVETAPLPFLVARLRSLMQPNCRIRYRSLWHEPLAGYDVVYCFLSPAPMPALWNKVCAEMGDGALLISNSFEVPDVVPEEEVPLEDWRHSRLLMYRPAGTVQG